MSTNIAERNDLLFAPEGLCSCGYEPSVVSPSEAAAMLRSLPRRWRSVVAFDLDAAEPETLLVERPFPTGWSALEHAGHVRDVLHALCIRVQRVLREDDPVLPETHVTPPSGANEQGPGVILAALAHTAEQLAQVVEMTPLTDWYRSGRRAGRTVKAIDLVREAVHEGVHHLKEASAQLEELRLAGSF
ncbi:MAG TPA: DinB family protein [Acidimicrobiales bacterium]